MLRSNVFHSRIARAVFFAFFPALAAHHAAAADTPAVGGPAGQEFRRECPDGQYLAGLEIRAGRVFDTVKALCAPLEASNARLGRAAPLKAVGGRSTGAPNRALCPSGQAVAAMRVTKSNGRFINAVQITCRNIETASATPQRCISTTRVCLGTNVECGTGELARGIHGRASSTIHALGLVCGPRPGAAPAAVGAAPPSSEPPKEDGRAFMRVEPEEAAGASPPLDGAPAGRYLSGDPEPAAGAAPEPAPQPAAESGPAPAATPPPEESLADIEPAAGASGAPDAAAAPPPPPPAAMPDAVRAPPAMARRLEAPAPVPQPPPPTRSMAKKSAKPPGAAVQEGAGPDGKWRLVPVYFGTDRKEEDTTKRVAFGSDRGRKLVLGRALISVPTAHEVPNVERPWALTIPGTNIKLYEEEEDPAKHFTMREIKTLTETEFLALVKERLKSSKDYKDQALIFIHGYNSSFDNAVYRCAQIAHDLNFDGAPFLYSWPSRGELASYTYDRASNEQSEPFMRDFVELVTKKSGAKSVSVIAHSMGNQLTMRVLRDLKNAKIAINQIILAAPDVDRDSFENIARELKGFSKGITLYAAANDKALIASKTFHGGVPRAGDVPLTGPVVVDGVDTIDVTTLSTDSLGLNHSTYAERTALIDDIARILKTGVRPPKKRMPQLVPMKSGTMEYWRFPAP